MYSIDIKDDFVDPNQFSGNSIQFRWTWPANPFHSSGRLYIQQYNNVVAYFRHRPYRRKCFFKTQKQEYVWKDIGIGSGWTIGIPGILYDQNEKTIATVTEMKKNYKKEGNMVYYNLFEISTSQDKFYITYQHEIMLHCIVKNSTLLLCVKDREGNLIMHAKPGRFCKELMLASPHNNIIELSLIFCLYANMSTLMSSGK
jgi:hypothetical protein